MATTHSRCRRWTIGLTGAVLSATVLFGGLPAVPANAAASTPSQSVAVMSESEAAEAMQRMRAARQALEAAGLLVSPSDGEVKVLKASNGAGWSLAKDFGVQAFEKATGFNAGTLLDVVLTAMGLESADNGLSEIQDSLDVMSKDLDALKKQLVILMEKTDQTNFNNSYRDAGEAVATLSSAFTSVTKWKENGIHPGAEDVSSTRVVITSALAVLDFEITDSTVGVVPLMMKAGTERVSDLAAYWEGIDLVRSNYRTAMAKGLVGLDTLTLWDQTGAVGSDLESQIAGTKDVVQRLYDYGVGIEQANQRSRAVANIGDTYYIAQDITASPGETWTDVSYKRSELEPVFKQMVATYDPEANGGQTLENYLAERNMPTRVNYPDTFYIYKHQPFVGKPTYRAKVVEGRIIGNKYGSNEIAYSHATLTTEMESKTYAQQQIDEARAHLQGVALRSTNIEPEHNQNESFASVMRWLHARHSDSIVAPGTYEPADTNDWSDLPYTKEALKPILEQLVANYRPSDYQNEDGKDMSLQDYLTAHGFATEYVYALDTAQASGGWTLTGNKYVHSATVTVGRIVGNAYQEKVVGINQVHTQKNSDKTESIQERDRLISSYTGRTAMRVATDIDTDVSGRAADFNPDAIKKAAFGVN